MKQDEIREKIKKRGYWRIHFMPSEPNTELNHNECKKLLRETQVKLRGWYFPHFNLGDLKNVEKGISTGTEYGEFVEAFKFFISGQFMDYLALPEDWLEQAEFFDRCKYESGTVLDYINTIFSVTEFFEFCARLAKANVFGKTVDISISLVNNSKVRKVFSLWDPMSFIGENYICVEPKIEKSYSCTKEQILAQASELAIDYVKHVFILFQWDNISIDALKSQQSKLFRR